VAELGTEPKVFRIYVGLALAIVICVSAFSFETWRAIDGNLLSWAYVVEWPLLLAYAVYMGRRMLREERGEVVVKPPEVKPEDDEALAAWNRYLAQLHASEGTNRSERLPD
jgi:hypothetical protein